MARHLCPLSGGHCLRSQGFERQAASQPHELSGHAFELVYERPGVFELVSSRMIFEISDATPPATSENAASIPLSL